MFYLSHVLVYQCSACSQKSNAMTSSCSHSSRFQDSFCVFVPFFYCLLISVDFLLSGIAAAKAPKEVPETTSMGIPNSCIAWITPKCTLPRAPPPPKQTPTAFPASSRATLPTSADICRHLPTCRCGVTGHATSSDLAQTYCDKFIDRNTKCQYLSI